MLGFMRYCLVGKGEVCYGKVSWVFVVKWCDSVGLSYIFGWWYVFLVLDVGFSIYVGLRGEKVVFVF